MCKIAKVESTGLTSHGEYKNFKAEVHVLWMKYNMQSEYGYMWENQESLATKAPGLHSFVYAFIVTLLFFPIVIILNHYAKWMQHNKRRQWPPEEDNDHLP